MFGYLLILLWNNYFNLRFKSIYIFQANYEVKIEKASLPVRKVKIAPQVLTAHAKV